MRKRGPISKRAGGKRYSLTLKVKGQPIAVDSIDVTEPHATIPMPILPPTATTTPVPLPPLPDSLANPASLTPAPEAASSLPGHGAACLAQGTTQAACGIASTKGSITQSDSNDKEVWQLTLAEAIRIGLDHEEYRTVFSAGPNEPVVVAPAAADAKGGAWRFRSAVMELAVGGEQYWTLSQHQVQLWSRATAVALGEEILKRELAKLEMGRSATADVAEARQRLENFKLQLVTATADVITVERQLRNILACRPSTTGASCR